ncbi:pre-peptidase C-terminal domain-containing protein [Leptolyngbya sp. NIES-2104]|uniref:pre-peptidase C-terminal domain-containing protein n=1 Tax=Leptolyngbya sp. NIES-2104 TaxID=1552121 RepID=UPI0006EC6BDA|nr:pre-peptidase C-terminal domain-containing protein [Leptolyngbya sp. NIES-2104]GAP99431.1 hypothetical protein NIES2104_59920 [Leptolyngbya sp. NIES-2104]
MNFNPTESVRSITPSATPQVFTGTVSLVDPFDLYQLQTSATNYIQLSLTGLSSNANIELIQERNNNYSIDANEILARSTNGNAISEIVNSILLPGTYFIRVSTNDSASTDYRLSATALSYATTNIVWQHSQTGSNVTWEMAGTTPVSASSLPQVADPNWQIAGSVDFNQDRSSDYLWRHSQSGENLIWLMDDTTSTVKGIRFLPQVPDRTWKMTGLADFDADGSADVLWRNTQSGENVLWLMSDGRVISGKFLPQVSDVNWQIAGAKDFDRNGSADIVWRNTRSGENLLWLMNRAVVVTSAFLPQLPDRTWEIAGIEDFDLDSFPDLLWRNTVTGGNVIWLTEGTVVESAVTLASVPDPNWRIVATTRRSDQPPAIDGVGNTRPTAFNIGTLNTTATFSEQLSFDDDQDVYQFRLENPSSLSITLTRLMSDATVQLLDVNGTVVALSTPTPQPTINQQLDAGTYYLRVSQTSQTPAYYYLTLMAFPYSISQYDFTYYYNGQDTTADYYSGTITTYTGTFIVEEWFDPRTSLNEIGANGRYLITRSRREASIADLDRVVIHHYYDSETAILLKSNGMITDRGGLGTEVGWLEERINSHIFGGDFLEADLRSHLSVRVQESLRQGILADITWTDALDENIRVELFKGDVFQSTIADATPSDGLLSWMPTSSFAIASDYQIRISSVLDSNIFTFSNSFAITSPGSIHVTSPNQGGLFHLGTIREITWSDDIPEDVMIELYKGNQFQMTIAALTESDGRYLWNIPTNLIDGTDYRIWILSVSNLYVWDSSDSPFTIRALGDPGNTLSNLDD